MGRFPSQKASGKQPIKKRGIKRFLRKIANLTRNSLKETFFPGDLEGTKSPQNYEK